MEEEDYEAFRRLFEDAYAKYLEFLRLKNLQQYLKEQHIGREVTRARFDLYVKTGSSFVAEENGKVIGYVASRTVSFMHGVDKLLWIEYVVVRSEYRRRGIGTALMLKLIQYANSSGADRIYSTINPDNEASTKLHLKAGFNVKSWKVASYRTTS